MDQRNVWKTLASASTRPRKGRTVQDAEWDFLYQTAPVGLALFDNELRFIRVNEQLARINGVPIKLHLRAYLRDVLPDLARTLEPLLRKVIDTGKPVLDREIHGTTPAAPEERWWLASFHPLKRGPQVYGVSCAIQEITEVHKTQQMLSLTQHSVDHASDEIFWLDESGQFVYVNQTACRKLEYTPSELQQMNVREIVQDSTPERYPQVWAKLHESGSMSFESTHRAKSGRTLPVEVALNLVEFNGQEYCFAVVRDIAERKEIEAREKRAQKSVARLQSKLLEIATDQELWSGGMSEAVARIDELVADGLELERSSVWLLDQPGKVVRALDVFERGERRHTSGQLLSLESSPEYLTAASQGRVIAATDVFTDPWTAVLAEEYFRAMDIRSTVNAPVRVAGKVQALLCVAHTGATHEWTPEEIHFVAEAADHVAQAMLNVERLQNEEALRRSEERYKAFIANAQESIWRLEFEPPIPVDLDEDEQMELMLDHGHLAEINDFGARLRGSGEGASDLIGMRLRDLVSYEHLKTDTIRMLMRNNFRFSSGVVPVEDRQGNTKYVFRTGSAVVENGLLRRIWGTGQDMTDLVLAQEKIRQLNASLEDQVAQRTTELRATVEELQAFSHSVSHDLRAPLLGIAACSKALIEDYSDRLEAGAMNWIKLIQRDAQHLDRLLNSLLALSRVTQAELFKQSVDLSAIAESVMSVLKQADPQRKVTAIIAEGMQVLGDPALLRVLMENLIGNAWKFSKARPESRIEVGVITPNSSPVYYVRDNGAGFDPRYASRLFAAFQRLHSSDFDGTGIGLATVRRIIHRHGGRVWTESAVDQGATFYFTLGRPEDFRA